MQVIPEILYKYRAWNDFSAFQKRIVTDSELYFSSSDQFNDPFDASLPFKYNEDELTDENIIKKMYLMVKQEYPNASDDLIHTTISNGLEKRIQAFKSGEYWKVIHSEVKKIINDLFGIFSLAKHNNNLLMWSHYADSHKGFCIGFDSEKIFNASNSTFCKVEYSREFPKLPLFGNFANDFLALVVTKSDDWKYEDEYRLLRTRMARKTILLPSDAYKELIFGFKMPQPIKEEIASIALSKYPEIKLFEAVVDSEAFKLNLIPYNSLQNQ